MLLEVSGERLLIFDDPIQIVDHLLMEILGIFKSLDQLPLPILQTENLILQIVPLPLLLLDPVFVALSGDGGFLFEGVRLVELHLLLESTDLVDVAELVDLFFPSFLSVSLLEHLEVRRLSCWVRY